MIWHHTHTHTHKTFDKEPLHAFAIKQHQALLLSPMQAHFFFSRARLAARLWANRQLGFAVRELTSREPRVRPGVPAGADVLASALGKAGSYTSLSLCFKSCRLAP